MCSTRYFYPRSPCGERRVTVLGVQHKVGISIHALLAESDKDRPRPSTGIHDFYPRSPCGERLHYDNYNLHCVEISIHALLAESDTRAIAIVETATEISIHALLAESDPTSVLTLVQNRNFYPRSPCGERLHYRVTLVPHQ